MGHLLFGVTSTTAEGAAGLVDGPKPPIPGPSFIVDPLILALPLGVPAVGVLLANAFLVQSWSTDANVYFSLNAVAWSLSAEAFFYLCFPALARVGWHHVGVVTAAVAIAALFADPAVLYVNPLARLPEFMAGIALANARLRPTSGATVSAAWAGTTAVAWALPFASGLAFLPASVLTIAYAAEKRDGWLTDPRLVVAGEASFTLYMLAHLFQRYAQAWFGTSHLIAMGSAMAALAVALAWNRRADLVKAGIMPQHSPAP